MTNTDALGELLPDLLAPLLMGGAVADPVRARRAAEQAIAQYQAGTQGELVTIGQIVAFGLTAIDNLRLSMPNTVPMTMKLRLRGNANALNRSSLKAVEALEKARAAAEPVWAEEAEPEPTEMPAPPPVPPPNPASPPVGTADRQDWATAMATVAGELQARATKVPPVQRKADQLWTEVLGNVAGELRQPADAPGRPAPGKASLFRSTIMAGSGGLPTCLTTETLPRRNGR